MMQRMRFDINTDTGTQGDTGPVFSGTIRQMGWAPTASDTGAALYVALINAQGDTSGGITLVNDEDSLNAGFLRAPVIPGASPDGFDTGVDQYFPPVAAGGRLRVKVTPASAGVAGKLYFWIDNG
jgi:hypothetical protein